MDLTPKEKVAFRLANRIAEHADDCSFRDLYYLSLLIFGAADNDVQSLRNLIREELSKDNKPL